MDDETYEILRLSRTIRGCLSAFEGLCEEEVSCIRNHRLEDIQSLSEQKQVLAADVESEFFQMMSVAKKFGIESNGSDFTLEAVIDAFEKDDEKASGLASFSNHAKVIHELEKLRNEFSKFRICVEKNRELVKKMLIQIQKSQTFWQNIIESEHSVYNQQGKPHRENQTAHVAHKV